MPIIATYLIALIGRDPEFQRVLRKELPLSLYNLAGVDLHGGSFADRFVAAIESSTRPVISIANGFGGSHLEKRVRYYQLMATEFILGEWQEPEAMGESTTSLRDIERHLMEETVWGWHQAKEWMPF